MHTRDAEFPMSWPATPYVSLSFRMPEAKSDEMSRRPRTIYCQKVATSTIERPLSIMPISRTPTIVPRIWNRPGLSVDAPMKNRSEGVQEVGIADILWSARALG